ncbi:unnamed protein product [Calypogeia fissa]
MAFLDSPRREPVPAFGGWKEDPSNPVIDYTMVFTRARASRLGSMPQDHDQDEYYSQPDETSSFSSDSRTMTRHSFKKNFFQFLVCGGRVQAVA